MSEFKVGDKVVNTEHKNSQVQKIELVEERRVKVFSTDMSFSYWAYNFQFRHATPEEIAAGHRIDFPTLPKPVGSLQELHPEFAKALHENFLELLGDDFPIENHISQLCKSKDV